MEQMRIRRLKVVGDEQGSNVPIKREKEWLAEDSHPPGFAYQELKIDSELLPSIKIEKDVFHNDPEANAFQGFTPLPQTDDYIKSELILDEELLLDDKNESEANCKQHILDDQKLFGAGISTKKSETSEPFSPSNSPKRLRNVEVNMLRNHSDKMQARYECGICSRSLKTKKDLRVHLRIHSRDSSKEFGCDLCGKTFYEKGNLNKHKKIHNGDKYACKVCGRLFTEKANLKAHMVRLQHFDKMQQFTPQNSNNDVASMKTELMSDEEFMDEGNGSESVSYAEETQQPVLAGENKEQTAVESVTCEVCHNIYPSELIKAHMRLKHKDETYKCQFCSRSYSTKGYLKVHLRLHSKDRKREFTCDVCEKTFYYQTNLASHKRIHTGDRYACKVCGHDFAQKESLKRHMVRRQHFDKPQRLAPQSSNNDVKTELMSDEEFIDEANDSESVSHFEGTQQPALTGDNKPQTGVDTAVDSVTCEICHNIYPGELIKAHMRIKHYDEASRSFKTKDDSKAPRRMHSKDRKREFACDLCEKAFYYQSNLSSHKKIHTGGGKIYPCNVCGHRFTRKENLKKHMMRRQHCDKPEQFTPHSSNNDNAPLKTDVISEEEFVDEGNGS